MLKRLSVIAPAMLILALTIAACNSKPQAPPPLPPEKELRLGQYPILPVKQQMTAAEVHRLGLRVERLAQPTMTFVNFRFGVDQRSDLWRSNHWHDKILPTGTMVAVDEQSRPLYLLDGSNRLYTPIVGQYQPLSPANSGGDWMPFGLSPWWLLVPVIGGLLWWLLRRRNREDTPPDDTPNPDQTRAGMRWRDLNDANNPMIQGLSDRMGTVEREIADVRHEVSSIRTSIVGMDERVAAIPDLVIERIGPRLDASAEAAKALLAEEIVRKGRQGKTDTVASLRKLMDSL